VAGILAWFFWWETSLRQQTFQFVAQNSLSGWSNFKFVGILWWAPRINRVTSHEISMFVGYIIKSHSIPIKSYWISSCLLVISHKIVLKCQIPWNPIKSHEIIMFHWLKSLKPHFLLVKPSWNQNFHMASARWCPSFSFFFKLGELTMVYDRYVMIYHDISSIHGIHGV